MLSSGYRSGKSGLAGEGRDPAQPAGLVVDERAPDLVLRVHHEWSIPRDRLVDRPAVHDEQARVRERLDHDLVAGALEHHELLAAGGLGGIDLRLARKQEERRGPALAEAQ